MEVTVSASIEWIIWIISSHAGERYHQVLHKIVELMQCKCCYQFEYANYASCNKLYLYVIKYINQKNRKRSIFTIDFCIFLYYSIKNMHKSEKLCIHIFVPAFKKHYFKEKSDEDAINQKSRTLERDCQIETSQHCISNIPSVGERPANQQIAVMHK